jgi:hypothetical protein
VRADIAAAVDVGVTAEEVAVAAAVEVAVAAVEEVVAEEAPAPERHPEY